jgi:bacterioferritin-associated ferredoxin
MYVCICKAVTDKQIQSCIRDGADTMEVLQDRLGVATRCGRCRCDVERMVEEQCLCCLEPCSVAA